MSNSSKLKQELKNKKLDYFILPNNDEFANEYLPDSEKRLEFITGFSGSNAIAIIGQKKSAFFTDGRYMLQAAGEVDEKEFEIYNLTDKTPQKWLLENSKKGDKIGFDGKLHSKNNIISYQKHLDGRKITILKNNPVDLIWTAKPKAPASEVFIHPLKYSGETSEKKCAKIIKDLDKNSDILILNSPTSICWLLNIRGADVEYTPFALCYALIYKNKKIELFIDEKRLSAAVKKHLKNVKIIAPEKLEKHLAKLKNIQIDPNYCNYWVYSLVARTTPSALRASTPSQSEGEFPFALRRGGRETDGVVIEKSDPCLIHKAIKNETEIKGAINAHIIDGSAVTKFLFWLEKNPNSDEISAAEKLLDFRKLNKDFVYPSFATISGFGSNGAIVHYHATKKSNKKFTKNNLYLIDSGGQYFCGTTDITRTIVIGKPNPEQIENFTRVIKGHIAIARAKFPTGTTGNNLDILARYHLWQVHKDYDHGTGHGVGSFLSVHEGPQGISKRASNIALQPGMILSNEPGYYEAGEYGIRIENLILVEKTSDPKFLQFKNLTLTPIDHRLIDFKMLTHPERKWLKDYHQEIYDNLQSSLPSPEKSWLGEIVKIYDQFYRSK